MSILRGMAPFGFGSRPILTWKEDDFKREPREEKSGKRGRRGPKRNICKTLRRNRAK